MTRIRTHTVEVRVVGPGWRFWQEPFAVVTVTCIGGVPQSSYVTPADSFVASIKTEWDTVGDEEER